MVHHIHSDIVQIKRGVWHQHLDYIRWNKDGSGTCLTCRIFPWVIELNGYIFPCICFSTGEFKSLCKIIVIVPFANPLITWLAPSHIQSCLHGIQSRLHRFKFQGVIDSFLTAQLRILDFGLSQDRIIASLSLALNVLLNRYNKTWPRGEGYLDWGIHNNMARYFVSSFVI